MSLFDRIYQKARDEKRKIVLPEGEDKRIVAAAHRALEMGIAEIVLLCPEKAHSTIAPQSGLTLIDPQTDLRIKHFAEQLYSIRQHKGLTQNQARQAVNNNLVFSALMVEAGEADGYVAGATNTTASVLRSALQIVGMASGSKQVSSFFIMEHHMRHQAFQGVALYADCAMMVDPNAEELADIAAATAQNARELLDIEPVVALLSFSTSGSAQHPHVDKVREAGEIVSSTRPDLQLLPEVQFDAAILPEVLAQKAPNIGVKGPANVLIFPDLQSANIGYKIAERIGGAVATGPILQGLSKPVNDLSRGCSVDDILRLIAITALQGERLSLCSNSKR